ncbi:MAG: Sua5/YciO/YrdC/YwlC family protein [Motiliproteus sp.]
MNAWYIKQAVRALRHGGVIAYPTEAVWGLGCDPWDRKAVMRLLTIKQRAVEKGLILVAADISQLGPLGQNLSESERSLISSSGDIPTTWLIPDPDMIIPNWIKGIHKDVAIRVSTHSGVKSLCKSYGGMLVSTSANRSGDEAAHSLWQVRCALGQDIDYILPGKLGGCARPSEIRALRGGNILRS